MTSAEMLRQTVRVDEHGVVTRGIEVPHRAANIRDGSRVVAATPHHAKAEHFRHNAGVPQDVYLPSGRRTDILGTTVPHDCRNHIVAFESNDDRTAREERA